MTLSLEIAHCFIDQKPIIINQESTSVTLSQNAERIHVSKGVFSRQPSDKSLSRGEIMIVDDTAMNVLVLEQMIRKKLKRTCVSFSSGHEAVKAVARRNEHARASGEKSRVLLLMDVNMPMMSGAETTRRVHALFDDAQRERMRKNLVVIAATGQEREDV